MVDVATAVAVGIAATFVPLFAGLAAPTFLAKLSVRSAAIWLAAFAVGIMFWFFVDVMNDASQLDVIQGFGNGLGDYTHLVLALMFALGLGFLFGVEQRYLGSRSKSTNTQGVQAPQTGLTVASIVFPVAALAALGIGFHAFGEGMDIGSKIPGAADIIGAIGGYYPGIAYVLHKFLEGFVVGVFAFLASATSVRKIAVLGALSGIPTVIGFFVGLPNVLDSSYFFALGAAAAVYVVFKLIPVISQSARLYAAIIVVLLGFYAMYFAGLLHS